MKEFLYKGGKFTFQWDPVNELVDIKIWGVHEKKDAEEFKKVSEDFLEKFPEANPAKMFIDCSEQEKMDYEARRVYTEAIKLPRQAYIAIIWKNALVRITSGFLMAASGRGNLKLFGDKEKAFEWLKKIKINKKSV
jgi:hypothetical protein